MKGEIFPGQNKDKLNWNTHAKWVQLGLSILKRLKHQYLSDTTNATWFHKKKSLFRKPEKDQMRFSERREKSHSPRICKTGFLCQLLYDGSKMELIVVRGDAVSDQKTILTEKSMSLKHLVSRTQWHFQRKIECSRGCPEVSTSPKSALHTCSFYCPTVWSDRCPWAKEQRV